MIRRPPSSTRPDPRFPYPTLCRSVTASTLVNGTFDGLLALAGPATEVTRVGPGTPLCPGLLGLGIDRLAGFVAIDREGCLRAIMEGAGARAFRRHGRAVVRRGRPDRKRVV